MNTPTVQPPIPPVAQPVPTPPPKKNPGVLIGIFLLFLGILVGLVIAKTTLLSTLRIPYLGASPTPTSFPTRTPTPDPTAGWKTYKNSSLGFELKYPSSVLIDKELNDQYNRATIFKGGNLNFEVMLRKSGGIALDNYYFMDSPITRKTTLAGNPANVYELPKGYCDGPNCSEPYIAIVIEKGSDLYHISFFGDVQLSKDENQILSTFRFVEQNSRVNCPAARPQVCTMICLQPPPYICGSDGKNYCSDCQACSNPGVSWYVMQATPCANQ